MKTQLSERWLIIGAFAVIYIIWGSTYLVNYIAIQAIPPFLMSGTRFLAAGGLLLLLSTTKKHPPITLRQYRNAVLMGFLFLSVGAGCVVWAEQFIDTGKVALLIAFDPLLVLFMMWAIQGSRPGPWSILGTILGILGMGLLVGQPQFTASKEAVWGLIAIGVSMVAWAMASIYVTQIELPHSKRQGTAIQMLGGGFFLLIFGAFSGEFRQFSFQKLTWHSGFSWLYLVLFGSLLAFSAFNYLLTKVSPAKVATSTFVNPIVALFLGWAFNAELLSTQSLVAAGILLSGVVFINSQ